jgi:hypothetical protein
MKRLIILLAIPLLFAACGDFFESDGTYYFDVEGEGYVYNETTNEPIPNVMVSVRTGFKSKGYATKQPVWEDFYVDETGYFRVKFIRRIDGENAAYFLITPLIDGYKDGKSINLETVKKAKTTIQLGNIIVKPY